MVHGGILPRNVSQPSVTVSWEWYNESQGIIKWKFVNPTDKMKIVALYRGYKLDSETFAYYFGDAFYPVYLGNPEIFRTEFIDKVQPLKDEGVELNSPPYGILKFSNGQLLPAFVYVLSPNQTYEMLEGGFSSSVYPTIYRAIELTPVDYSPQLVCIGYPESSVVDWDNQSGTFLQGFQPNPKNFTSIVFHVDPNAPYVSLWSSVYYKLGKCPHSCILRRR